MDKVGSSRPVGAEWQRPSVAQLIQTHQSMIGSAGKFRPSAPNNPATHKTCDQGAAVLGHPKGDATDVRQPEAKKALFQVKSADLTKPEQATGPKPKVVVPRLDLSAVFKEQTPQPSFLRGTLKQAPPAVSVFGAHRQQKSAGPSTTVAGQQQTPSGFHDTTIKKEASFINVAGELVTTERNFTKNLGQLEARLGSEAFSKFQEGRSPQEQSVLGALKQAVGELKQSQDQLMGQIHAGVPFQQLQRSALTPSHPDYAPDEPAKGLENKGKEKVVFVVDDQGNLGARATATLDVAEKITSLMQSSQMEEHFALLGKVQVAYSQLEQFPGLRSALSTALAAGDLSTKQKIEGELVEPGQRQGKYELLMRDLSDKVEGPGKGVIEAAMTKAQHLVRLNNVRQDFAGQVVVRKLGASNMDLAIQTVRLLDSFLTITRLSSKSKAEAQATQEGIVQDALKHIEASIKNGEGTNVATFALLKQIKSFPGARKQSEQIQKLEDRLWNNTKTELKADLSTMPADIVAQIALGNKNLAEGLGKGLTDLAPALHLYMTALSGLSNPESIQAQSNILQFVQETLTSSSADVSTRVAVGMLSTVPAFAKAIQDSGDQTLIAMLQDHSNPAPAHSIPVEKEIKTAASTFATRLLAPKEANLRQAFLDSAGLGTTRDITAAVFDHLADQYADPGTSMKERANIVKFASDFVFTSTSFPSKLSAIQQGVGRLAASVKASGDGQAALPLEAFARLQSLPASSSPASAPVDKSREEFIAEAKQLGQPYKLAEKSPEQLYRDVAASTTKALAQVSISEFDAYVAGRSEEAPSVNRIAATFNSINDLIQNEMLFKKGGEKIYKNVADAAALALKNGRYDVAMNLGTALTAGPTSRLFGDKLNNKQKATVDFISKMMDANWGSSREAEKSAEGAGRSFLPPFMRAVQPAVMALEGNPGMNEGQVNENAFLVSSGIKQSFAKTVNVAKSLALGIQESPDLLASIKVTADQTNSWGSQAQKEGVQYAQSYALKARGTK